MLACEATTEAPSMSAAPPHAVTPMASSDASRTTMAIKVANIGFRVRMTCSGGREGDQGAKMGVRERRTCLEKRDGDQGTVMGVR